MNSRTIDPGHALGGNKNLLKAASGHGCINMMSATKVVTLTKDYGLSQPELGKEPSPLESPLQIENPMDKLEAPPHIPKGVLKRSGYNPNARATHNYSVAEDLDHTLYVMYALEVLQSCLSQRNLCFLLLGLVTISFLP